MAEESAKLRIPFIAAAQAQKHVTHNEALTLLDTLVQLSVLDKDLTEPPAEPEEGDCYIVAAEATGAWEGWDTRVARYIDGEWRSYLPGAGAGAGWLAWVLDEDAMYRFDGEAWALAGIEGPPGADGALFFAQDEPPSTDNPASSLWIDTDSAGLDLYRLTGEPLAWTDTAADIKGPQGDPGEDGEDGTNGADGVSFQPDAVVALVGGRDAYDDEAAFFSVLVIADAGNDDKPTLYFKLSAASADWSDGITWAPEGAASGGGATVRAATTADITIATDLNDADTLDGVTLAAGDLVLVKDQSSPEENGVYVVGAAPARSAAFGTFDQHPGALVTVQEGTANAGLAFLCVAAKGGTLNTDPIDFLDLWTAMLPAGEIVENYDETARPGFINLDGSTITDGALDNPRCAARYPWMVSGDDLVLPDRRGKFDRVWDDGAGTDPDAASRTARAGDAQTGDYPGTEQADAMQGHWHQSYAGNDSRNPGSGGVYYGTASVQSEGISSPSVNASGNSWTRAAVTDGSHGTPRIAGETRPVNHSVCKQMRLG